MKIGLLGGSFDPPHYGHIGISKDALSELKLDQIWWLPTKQNPLKNNEISNFDHRLELCEEITQSEIDIIVKDTEKYLKSTYFIDLLTNLVEKNPEDEFFVLIGADNVPDFHKWHQWQDILKKAKLVVFERNNMLRDVKDSEVIKHCKDNEIIFINNGNYNTSSTKIRNTNE